MEWIKVEDRLPDLGVNVLAMEKNHTEIGVYALCEMADDNNELCTPWCNCYGDVNGDAEFDDEYVVTHWMPLPEPPK